MSADSPAFTIVHRVGQKSETEVTGLSKSAAREWLENKARQLNATLTEDLIIKTNQSDETWAAVESE